VNEHADRHQHRRHDRPIPVQRPQTREQHQVQHLVVVADLVEEVAAGRQQQPPDQQQPVAHQLRADQRDGHHNQQRGEHQVAHAREDPIIVMGRDGERVQHRADQHPPMEALGDRDRVQRRGPVARQPKTGVCGDRDGQHEHRERGGLSLQRRDDEALDVLQALRVRRVCGN
jgi:hypothetical protein